MRRYEEQLKADGVKPAEYRRNIPPVDNRRRDDSLGDSERHFCVFAFAFDLLLFRNIYEALCRDEVPVVGLPFLPLPSPSPSPP